MAGRVESMDHGDRSVFVKFHKSGNKMFDREDVKKYTTGEF